jgi:hypothetical protein
MEQAASIYLFTLITCLFLNTNLPIYNKVSFQSYFSTKCRNRKEDEKGWTGKTAAKCLKMQIFSAANSTQQIPL